MLATLSAFATFTFTVTGRRRRRRRHSISRLMQFGKFTASIPEDHLKALQILGEPDLGEFGVDVVDAAVEPLAERQPLFHFHVGEGGRYTFAGLVDGRFHFAQQLP